MTRRSRTSQRGFTLLEVMLALAILTTVTAFISVVWSKSMDKATDAVARRELREVADTVFRRVLYEIQEHSDQQQGSLEEFYGEWTGFRGLAKEKWRHYTYELLKKEKVVAGSADTDGDAESLFGDSDEDDDDTTSGSRPSASETNESLSSIILLEITLNIYEVDGETSDPLISLRTYIRPPDTGETR